MPRIVEVADISGVLLVELERHGDERGVLVETYRRSWFPLGREMVQGNRSDKQAGALVGLHYHLHQADYFDLGGGHQMGEFIPPGIAHGFSTLEDATLRYLVDGYYNPDDELGVAWDDPHFAADRGVEQPILSERGRRNPRRSEIPRQRRAPSLISPRPKKLKPCSVLWRLD